MPRRLRASLRASQVCHRNFPPVVAGRKWEMLMVAAIFWLLHELIHLYVLAIIAAVVISMLISFGVINARSQFVYTIADFLNRLTNPYLNVIRRILPDLGGIDISPVIGILLLEALDIALGDIFNRLVIAGLAF
jgi:YggT family protein